MGDFGIEPWETDESADWFHKFWRTKSFDLIESGLNEFNPSNENYEEIRAIAHVLISFGSPYAFPIEYLEKRESLFQGTINILENMIHPPNEDWGFLEMWDNDEKVIISVNNQILYLQSLLKG